MTKKIHINWFVVIFLLLFPGFFFYHTLLARQLIPPFLGGFFGIVSMIFLPIAIVIFLRQLARREISLNRLDILYLLIVLYTLCVVFVQYVFGSGYDYEEKLFTAGLSSIILGLLMYLIGRNIDIKSKSFSRVLIIFLLLMSLIAVVNIGDSGIFYLAQEVGFDEGIASYQGFGRSLLVVAIFCLVTIERRLLFTLVATVSFIALFVNGARTEFAGFVLSLLVLSLFRFPGSKIIVFSISACAIMLPLFWLLPDVVFEKSRIFELFNVSESSSYVARSELKDDAIQTILNNPLFGEYGSYAKNGEIGNGAHNILSAWVDLGIFGFLGYVALLLTMVSVLFKYRFLLSGDKYYWLACALFSYVLFALLSSKEHGYMLVGLTVGVVGRLSYFQIRSIS